jgi:hypothetical protein
MFDFPGSPTTGSIATGPNGAAWQWDGVKWLSTTQGAQTILVSDTPPANAVPNTLWWDSTSAQLFVRYADANSTQWVQANSATADIAAGVAPAQNNAGRNLLHNSLFNVAQRGAGPWTGLGYTADRWEQFVSVDTVSTTLASVALGGMAGDEAASNALAFVLTGNVAANAYTFVVQMIEDVRRLSGKTVTISFVAYIPSGTATRVGVGLRQSFGTGGSPSAVVDINATLVTISATPTRYSVTIALPSIVGKTLGTNNDHATRLAFFLSSGANINTVAGGIGVQSGTFVFWGIQLEIGTQATPLEKPDPQQDLAKCQRFYYPASAFFGGYNTAGQNIASAIYLPVPMRATPTIVPGGTGANNNVGTVAFAVLNVQSIAAYVGVTATGAASVNMGFTASADL